MNQPPAGYPKDVRVISDVDIYDKPGGDGNVVGTLEKDRIVAIWECREDNWCPISGGWVWGDFLDKNYKAGPAGGAAPKYPMDVKVNGDVDIYDKPGGDGNVVGTLEKGRTVAIWECREDNWCPISGGWVWGDFLDR